MLRILHIDSGREWRGAQRQTFLLARGLRAGGVEPLVVAVPRSLLLQRVQTAGVAAAGVRMRGRWDLTAIRRLRTLVRTWAPDAVHTHDARAKSLAVAALVGRRRIPIVVTRSGSAHQRLAGQVGRGHVAHVIATSHATARALATAGIPSDRVTVVLPGLPPPTVERRRDWRAECRWPENTLVGGVLGASSVGGAEFLAGIAQAIPDELRPRLRLVVLGGAGLGHATIGGIEAFHAGFVDAGQAALAGLDMLWHLSSASGLGTTVIDAMALGVPPIAFAADAFPELIDHDVSGLLSPPFDVEAFARSAASLIQDERRRHTLALGGPAQAARFSVETMVGGVDLVYRTVRRRWSATRRWGGRGPR